MPFVWVQDISPGAVIHSADLLEIRTNVDYVEDNKCAADDVTVNASFNSGVHSGEDTGYDGTDRGTVHAVDDVIYNGTYLSTVYTGEDTGYDGTYNSGVNYTHDTPL